MSDSDEMANFVKQNNMYFTLHKTGKLCNLY